jgi:hypothetical protein
MLSKRSGPGALAGAAEAYSRCLRNALHTSFAPPAQRACDGRTKLRRAFRAFSALPDRERSQSLLRLVRPANGQRWNIHEATRRTGIPAESIMLALMTCGSTDGLTGALIEQMGWGAHLIILSNGGGRLVSPVPSGFRNVEAGQWFSQSIAELHPDDSRVLRLRDHSTLPIEQTARLLRIDYHDALAWLRCHRLGGLFIDDTPFVSCLHLGRLGAFAARGRGK